jgi:hypothetical protein
MSSPKARCCLRRSLSELPHGSSSSSCGRSLERSSCSHPASAKVTESSGATWSSQGVRQLCPEGVFTSAPAGSDSNRTAAVGGDEFRKFRLGTEAEQAATVNPHAMTAMTRLIITPHFGGLQPPYPEPRPCRTAREGSTHRKQSARYGLKCDGDKVQGGYGYLVGICSITTPRGRRLAAFRRSFAQNGEAIRPEQGYPMRLVPTRMGRQHLD